MVQKLESRTRDLRRQQEKRQNFAAPLAARVQSVGPREDEVEGRALGVGTQQILLSLQLRHLYLRSLAELHELGFRNPTVIIQCNTPALGEPRAAASLVEPSGQLVHPSRDYGVDCGAPTVCRQTDSISICQEAAHIV